MARRLTSLGKPSQYRKVSFTNLSTIGKKSLVRTVHSGVSMRLFRLVLKYFNAGAIDVWMEVPKDHRFKCALGAVLCAVKFRRTTITRQDVLLSRRLWDVINAA